MPKRGQKKAKLHLRYSEPAIADAGPNERPRHGAPLSSDFMTPSCSVNRVTITVERKICSTTLANWTSATTTIEHFCQRSKWNLLVLTRAFCSRHLRSVHILYEILNLPGINNAKQPSLKLTKLPFPGNSELITLTAKVRVNERGQI